MIICITIPGTAELYQIGYAISLALNPDRGETNNFGPEFVPDVEGNPVRPEVYTTYDFPCSEAFAATAQALAADPTKMHAAVTADYAQRWPDLTPPTLEQCAVFCAAALVELSANALTTNGAFVLGAPFGTGTATYDQYVRGTVVSGAALGSTPAPTTNVITAVGDIAGDLNRVTKNGTTSNQIGGDLGTGNFGNHVLNVGRRNNASLPFNGRLYQLALKGKAMTAAEIATVESFVNSKTKAF